MDKTVVVNLRKEQSDVYIGRGSRFGNPYSIGIDGTREEVMEKFRRYLELSPELLSCLHELKGKRLGCYCKPKACHGDILVEFIEKISQ